MSDIDPGIVENYNLVVNFVIQNVIEFFDERGVTGTSNLLEEVRTKLLGTENYPYMGREEDVLNVINGISRYLVGYLNKHGVNMEELDHQITTGNKNIADKEDPDDKSSEKKSANKKAKKATGKKTTAKKTTAKKTTAKKTTAKKTTGKKTTGKKTTAKKINKSE